jgi:hypothetical protein
MISHQAASARPMSFCPHSDCGPEPYFAPQTSQK